MNQLHSYFTLSFRPNVLQKEYELYSYMDYMLTDDENFHVVDEHRDEQTGKQQSESKNNLR